MEKDIGRIKKNDTADIVVRVDDFGGNPGVTIREFVTSDRYTGFTKSGVRILAGDFPKFKEMINSVSEKDLEQTGEAKTDAKQKTLKKNSNDEEMPDY